MMQFTRVVQIFIGTTVAFEPGFSRHDDSSLLFIRPWTNNAN